jgi:hypothetical protein
MGMMMELREKVFTPGARVPQVGAMRGRAAIAKRKGARRVRIRRLRVGRDWVMSAPELEE